MDEYAIATYESYRLVHLLESVLQSRVRSRNGNLILGHQLPGMDPETLVVVRLLGIAYLDNEAPEDGFNYTSTLAGFPLRRAQERDGVSSVVREKFEEYREGGYEAFIYQVEISLIPSQGGCTKILSGYKADNVRWSNQVTDNHNCLFACLGVDADAFRRRFRLGYDEKVTLAQAFDVVEFLGKRLYVYLHDFKRWHPYKPHCVENNDTQVLLSLKQDHYALCDGVLDFEVRKWCARCRVCYVNTHKCLDEIYAYCLMCAEYHAGCCRTSKTPPTKHKKARVPKRYHSGFHEDLDFSSVIHYDIETYKQQRKSCVVHVPYIIGWVFRNTYSEFMGRDCIKRFVDWLMQTASRESEDTTLYLDAFNGSNFDHHYVLGEILKKYPDKQFVPLFKNGSIIGGGVENVRFFDLCRHTVGSLSKNLQAYGCKTSKGELDHELSTPWHLTSEERKAQVRAYLKSDVLGLQELYEKIAGAVWDEFGTNLFLYLSTSQLTYRNWLEDVESDIFLPTEHEEHVMRKAIYGGRTQVSKREFISSQYKAYVDGGVGWDDVHDYLVDMDVVSLYPAAMRQFRYPAGEFFVLQKADIEEWNLSLARDKACPQLSVLFVRYIPNKELAHAVLPSHKCGALEWTLLDGSGWYTSADIDNALRFGYKIRIKQGFYWRESAGCFNNYIDKVYMMKRDAARVPALKPKYLLAKLMMNGLYGKMIQRPNFANCEILRTASQVHQFAGEHTVVDFVDFQTCMYISGVPKDHSKWDQKITKPVYLGAFVLAYSRRIMLEYMSAANTFFKRGVYPHQQKRDLFYTDTDSMQLHRKYAPPTTETLGGINNDLGDDAKIIRGYWIAPKLYMLEYIRRGVPGTLFHFRGKGIAHEALNIEMFEWMDGGRAVQTMREFRLEKTFFRSVNTAHLELFDILHKSWEDNLRTLNMKPWEGRYFFPDRTSVPHGHALIPLS